ESSANLDIRRIGMPAHRSDMLGQARAFIHFARAALRHVAQRDYDLVFATSSRLMTAALGALIARRKRARLYLDVRDIFVDTIGDVLPRPLAWPLRQLLAPLERWTMRRADRINLVSRGFEEYFRERYPDRSFAWFTNGIDDEFLVPRPTEPVPSRERDARVTILYAGNIGEGQALHKIVPGLARAARGARARDRRHRQRGASGAGVPSAAARCVPLRRRPVPAPRRAAGVREGFALEGVRV